MHRFEASPLQEDYWLNQLQTLGLDRELIETSKFCKERYFDLYDLLTQQIDISDRICWKYKVSPQGNPQASPAHFAAWFGHLQVLDWLLKLDPNLLTAKDLHRQTIVHYAAMNNQEKVIAWIEDNTAALLGEEKSEDLALPYKILYKFSIFFKGHYQSDSLVSSLPLEIMADMFEQCFGDHPLSSLKTDFFKGTIQRPISLQYIIRLIEKERFKQRFFEGIQQIAHRYMNRPLHPVAYSAILGSLKTELMACSNWSWKSLQNKFLKWQDQHQVLIEVRQEMPKSVLSMRALVQQINQFLEIHNKLLEEETAQVFDTLQL